MPLLTPVTIEIALVLGISFVVAGFVFVTNSVLTGFQEFGAWVEDKRSIHRIVSAAKNMPSKSLHSLATEIMVWDTLHRLEWFENKSMLENPIRGQEIARYRKILSEERVLAKTSLDHKSDKEIIKIIKTKAKERSPIWRKDLLKKLGV